MKSYVKSFLSSNIITSKALSSSIQRAAARPYTQTAPEMCFFGEDIKERTFINKFSVLNTPRNYSMWATEIVNENGTYTFNGPAATQLCCAVTMGWCFRTGTCKPAQHQRTEYSPSQTRICYLLLKALRGKATFSLPFLCAVSWAWTQTRDSWE